MFCHASLGSNEAIEHFSVGRRLAFDAAKGRLWAVCRSCERWNLSPLEERWEAIEECERLFRDTKLRVSTDNIGLARVKEGTTLVRVGDPQRPEMAAWRYGDQFHRRRRKRIALMSAGVVVVGGWIVAGPVLGLIGGASVNLINVPNLLLNARTVARVRSGGRDIGLNRSNVNQVRLRPNDATGFTLEIPESQGRTGTFRRKSERFVLEGSDALSAARVLLPYINRGGGNAETVERAVGVLGMARGPEELFSHFAFHGPGRIVRYQSTLPAGFRFGADNGMISAMPAAVRLALEMSLHEEDERRALEGELAELEDRWREAEEVAAISDDMFAPPAVTALFDRMRGKR
jgi:hypothetical protein